MIPDASWSGCIRSKAWPYLQNACKFIACPDRTDCMALLSPEGESCLQPLFVISIAFPLLYCFLVYMKHSTELKFLHQCIK
jgi:hypothetical protein